VSNDHHPAVHHACETVPISYLTETLDAFLATTKARFMTGAIIDLSGGWPASPPRP